MIMAEWMKEELEEKERCQKTREDEEQGRNAVLFIVLSIYGEEDSPQTPVFLLLFHASESDFFLLLLLS